VYFLIDSLCDCVAVKLRYLKLTDYLYPRTLVDGDKNKFAQKAAESVCASEIVQVVLDEMNRLRREEAKVNRILEHLPTTPSSLQNLSKSLNETST